MTDKKRGAQIGNSNALVTPDPRENLARGHRDGKYDISAEAAREVAKKIEAEGGFWGPKSDKN